MFISFFSYLNPVYHIMYWFVCENIIQKMCEMQTEFKITANRVFCFSFLCKKTREKKTRL